MKKKRIKKSPYIKFETIWWRKNRDKQITKHEIYIKKIIRTYQSNHNGIDGSKIIPKHTLYCCDCPYYQFIKIPTEELDQHVGIVAVGQTGIGYCKFIELSDDDMDGWGLLWDGCKECGIG